MAEVMQEQDHKRRSKLSEYRPAIGSRKDFRLYPKIRSEWRNERGLG